jgi:hypothetical protein
MKRLRDMRGDDPQLKQAQQLLNAVAPLTPARARLTRVWRALEQGPVARPEPRRRLTLLLALGLVLLLSALAAAQGVVAVRAILASVTRSEGSALPSAKTRAKPKLVRASATAAGEPVQASSTAHAPAIPDAEPAATSASSTLAITPSHDNEHSALRSESRVRGAGREQNSQAELVRLAIMALRRDRDAERAALLLEQAYAANPRGPLAEEVLSLRVEAALTRGDARALSYAKQYLTRYPRGRYRLAVERALGPEENEVR